jgi:hypothetical protein
MADRITTCRFCGGSLTIPFCDLGSTPLANSYISPQATRAQDPVFPLNAVVCERCFLVQLDYGADASNIFSDYAYFSSFSSTWLAHATAFTQAAIARHRLDTDSFVVEVASNDGYLLRNFVSSGIPCLGIEPAINVAATATALGVPTRIAFFGRSCAAEIVADHGHADLIVANNVLAHVPDLNDFVAGLAALAGRNGSVSIEVPHLLALIEHLQFDTIYHEHYAYWSLETMRKVLAAHGLLVYSVEILSTHGTSLRVLASANPLSGQHHAAGALSRVEAQEAVSGLGTASPYQNFEPKVRGIITATRDYMRQAHQTGRRVAAYGAAAKGSTFLNACLVTDDDIAMVADRNPTKQGKLLPGSRIPIVRPETLIEYRPDDVLILPWNLAGEIAKELSVVREWGGRLLVAMPRLQAVA